MINEQHNTFFKTIYKLITVLPEISRLYNWLELRKYWSIKAPGMLRELSGRRDFFLDFSMLRLQCFATYLYIVLYTEFLVICLYCDVAKINDDNLRSSHRAPGRCRVEIWTRWTLSLPQRGSYGASEYDILEISGTIKRARVVVLAPFTVQPACTYSRYKKGKKSQVNSPCNTIPKASSFQG